MEGSGIRRLLAIVLLVLSACVQAGTSRVLDTTSEPPEPVCNLLPRDLPESFPLRFNMVEYDFGRISDAKTLYFEVWFENVSDREVCASYVSTSCGMPGCLVPNHTLAPGEKKHIDVTINPAKRPLGEYKRMITIELYGKMITLPIKGFIVPRVMFTPTKTYLMEVPTATGKATTVEVCGHGHNFNITSISVLDSDGCPASDPLEISKGPREPVVTLDEPYVRIPVTITVPPGTPIGEHAWMIHFEFSGVDDDVRP